MVWVAKAVSRVFDPVLLVPLVLGLGAGLAYLNGYRYGLLVWLMVFDAILPGLMVIYLFIRNRGRDWDIRDRVARIPILLTVVATHGLGVVAAWWLQRVVWGQLLLGLWVVAVVMCLIMIYWKISLHTAVTAILVWMAGYWLAGRYWWAAGLVGLVGWARVVDRDHTPAQVIAGAVVPVVILAGLSWFWGV